MRISEAMELLGFPPYSHPSPSEVKAAYRKMVMESHPDRVPTHLKSQAEAKFKEARSISSPKTSLLIVASSTDYWFFDIDNIEDGSCNLQASSSYQLNLTAASAEDVLIHLKVLAEAKDPDKRPAFAVRFLRTYKIYVDEASNYDGNQEGAALSTRSETSYINLHEIIISTVHKPNLLSKLSHLLSDLGLNIREAHVFSTVDDYCLTVFVFDGWPIEDTDGLHKALEASSLRNEYPSSRFDSST